MNNKRIYINRIVACLSILAIFIGIWETLYFLIVDDTSSYTRVMMHEMYSQGDIDYLFCGASLCYQSFDTTVLDEALSANTFNLGSSAQDIDVTYHLMKEAFKNRNVNHVYLELSPIMAVNIKKDERDASDLTGVVIISDYMKPSLNKLSLLVNASDSDCYAYSFFPPRRQWESLFDLETVINTVNSKLLPTYRNYGYENLKHKYEWYSGKGYVEIDAQMKPFEFNDRYADVWIDKDNISSEWYEYLEKIIELCDKRDVELTFVCAPLSNYLLTIFGEDYSEYHKLLSEISDENGIELWDFNLVDKEKMGLEISDFEDSAHLNRFGAYDFSMYIADIINGKRHYEEECYDNVCLMLKNEPAELYGVKNGENSVEIIANKEDCFEYAVEIMSEDGMTMLLQDFSKKNCIELPEGYKGPINIVCRKSDGSGDLIKTSYER